MRLEDCSYGEDRSMASRRTKKISHFAAELTIEKVFLEAWSVLHLVAFATYLTIVLEILDN